jgi:hypothetical protein
MMKSILIGSVIIAVLGGAAYLAYDVATSTEGGVMGERIGFAGRAIYESHQRQPEPKRVPAKGKNSGKQAGKSNSSTGSSNVR